MNNITRFFLSLKLFLQKASPPVSCPFQKRLKFNRRFPRDFGNKITRDMRMDRFEYMNPDNRIRQSCYPSLQSCGSPLWELIYRLSSECDIQFESFSFYLQNATYNLKVFFIIRMQHTI